MERITVNNITVTKDKAIQGAREIFDTTGTPVEVCDTLGGTIMYITKEGKEIFY